MAPKPSPVPHKTVFHGQQHLSHSMWPQIYVRPPKLMLHTSICYPDSLIKANDTIKLGLGTCKIMHFIKFGVGNVVMVIGGRKRGCVGVIKKGEKHKGSFEATHIQDAVGNVFEKHQSNVFTVVEGTEPWVSLAKYGASSCPSLKRQGGDGKLKQLLVLI